MFFPDPGSNFFPSQIPDPNFFHPGSQISIKEFKYFNPKKWFLRSRKYNPGCSSRIRILTFYPSRIPDPGVKKAPDPGSGSETMLKISLCWSGDCPVSWRLTRWPSWARRSSRGSRPAPPSSSHTVRPCPHPGSSHPTPYSRFGLFLICAILVCVSVPAF